MGKAIACECGHVVRASVDEELLRLARMHIAQSHPDMIGKVADDELLAMAVER